MKQSHGFKFYYLFIYFLVIFLWWNFQTSLVGVRYEGKTLDLNLFFVLNHKTYSLDPQIAPK